MGYGLLDYVTERVTGEPFADYMRRQVFEPLGMRHTSVGIADSSRQVATHYNWRRTGIIRPGITNTTDHPGASAVYASAHDLLRFALFHLGTPLPDQEPILSPKSLDLMHRSHTPPGAAQAWGLGWGVSRGTNGVSRLSHEGWMMGAGSVLYVYPEHGAAIAIVTNARAWRDGDWIGVIAEEIAEALLPADAPQLRGQMTAFSGWSPYYYFALPSHVELRRVD